jgi:ferredoxin
MAYMISDECIMCGLCAAECQNEAITEGEERFVIDPDRCTECVGAASSAKCAKECATGAAVPDPSRRESTEQLLAKWQSLHPGKAPRLF